MGVDIKDNVNISEFNRTTVSFFGLKIRVPGSVWATAEEEV